MSDFLVCNMKVANTYMTHVGRVMCMPNFLGRVTSSRPSCTRTQQSLPQLIRNLQKHKVGLKYLMGQVDHVDQILTQSNI